MRKVRYTPNNTNDYLLYTNLTPGEIYDVIDYVSSDLGNNWVKVMNDIGKEEFCYIYGINCIEFVDITTEEYRDEIINEILK